MTFSLLSKDGTRRCDRVPEPTQEFLDAKQKAQDSVKLYEEALQAVEAAKKEMEDAKQAFQALQGDEDGLDEDPSSYFVPLTISSHVTTRMNAPDDWIEEYCSGKEKPLVIRGDSRHSSVRVDLEIYSGRAVDWFEWIELFHALVHRTSKSPGEELAILKRNVRGDTADIVYGLGGGEGAYKDALRRLKSTCGSRSVMRAVHLEALNREEAPKGDPASFRRYAEKVRTHLFNLSYIGEAGHADIIERLAQKLQIQDRLAWNDGRRGGLEHRTINEFGVWLCARASAYQNAYSIAADQYQKPNQTPRHQQQQTSYGSKRNVPAHHGAGTFFRQEGKVEENQEAEEHCFKCEGAHLLHTCTFFKALPVSDRTTFVMRRGLCFCCLGIRHNARDCKEKKSCTIGRCKLSHHPLLHNEAVRDARSCHAMDSEPKPIAFGVIQLEAESADGELIPVSVLIDPASTATFFREGIVRSLKLHGHSQTLRVEGVAETSSTTPSEYLDLRIRTAFGEVVTLQGSTLPSVTKPVPFVNWEMWRKRWPHLDELPEIRPAGGRIDILIGLNHNTFTTATESRIGGDDEPTAEKTRLGWIVKGVVDELGTEVHVHRPISSADVDVELLGRDTKKIETGYEISALWNDGIIPSLPDCPELKLLHDATAKYRGCCLNKYVVSGPALRNPHPYVIIKFREGAATWSANVGALFSWIRLNAADRRYHRFPWPKEDGTSSTCKKMQAACGVSRSPFVAIRSMWRSSDDAGPTQKDVTTTVRPLTGRAFGTGSSTVLNRVRAWPAKYRVYVSCRIGEFEIRKEANEWRFVPEILNPVDAATSSQLKDEAGPYSWLGSSSFLLEQLSAWPMDSPWMAEKEEMRSARLNIADSQVILVFNWTTDRITFQVRPALIQRDEKYRHLNFNHVIGTDFVPYQSSLIPDPESEMSSGENVAAKSRTKV